MPNYKDMSPEEKRAYHTQALAEHKRRKEKGRAKTHHGGWGTPEYIAFRDAKSRCENPRNKRYADWGGRGIRFLFTSFEQFLAHIGTRPQGLTLDRKDNDGNYELGNVHWTTRRAQTHNRRSVN